MEEGEDDQGASIKPKQKSSKAKRGKSKAALAEEGSFSGDDGVMDEGSDGCVPLRAGVSRQT